MTDTPRDRPEDRRHDEPLVVELDDDTTPVPARSSQWHAGTPSDPLVVTADPPADPTRGPSLAIGAADLQSPRGVGSPAAPRRGPAAFLERLDRTLVIRGWLRPILHGALVVGVVAALSLVTGGVVAFVATGNSDAIRPGVPAGGFLFFAAYGSDVAVMVQHPAAIVGYSVDALLLTWMLVPTALYVAFIARVWRRLGPFTIGAWFYLLKLAIVTAVGVAVLGLFANQEIERGTEKIVSTISVGSAVVRSLALVAFAGLIVMLGSGVADRLRATGRDSEFADRAQHFGTGLAAGIRASIAALGLLALVSIGIAFSAAPTLRAGLPIAVLSPQLAGNVSGLAAPVAFGGSTEIAAKRSVTVSDAGAQAVELSRVETTLGDDHTLTDGDAPILFPAALLLLPACVAAQSYLVLRRARPSTTADRFTVTGGLVAGVVLTVALVTQLAGLRLAGIIADPVSGFSVLGSADMTTSGSRAAWLALLWSAGAAGVTALVWTSQNPARRRDVGGAPR